MHEHEEAFLQNFVGTKPGSVKTDAFFLFELGEIQLEELQENGIAYEVLAPSIDKRDIVNGDLPDLRDKSTTRKLFIRPQLNISEEISFRTPATYKLKITGPLLESYKKAIESLQISILEFDPPFSYVVRLISSDQYRNLERLPFVEQIDSYDAHDSGGFELFRVDVAEKLKHAPLEMKTWDILLHRPADLDEMLEWLGMKSVSIAGNGKSKIRCYLEDGSPMISDILNHPLVKHFSEYEKPKFHNDLAREIVGIGSANPAVASSYQGEGELIGVADTGIDDTHPDITANLFQTSAWGISGSTQDSNGHGTHVAGSIAGDGTASAGEYKGMAPKAKLFFQAILNEKNELELPVQLEELYEEAYQAGVRIHNNSWGASTQSRITASSIEVDEVVWNRKDMLLVFSAGNDGAIGNSGNVPAGNIEFYSIGSPASAKNVLTVGASRSSRNKWGFATFTYAEMWPKAFKHPPVYDVETVSGNPACLAAFSSRGPCDDDRIKPDVVAPGTDIISAKSAQSSPSNFWAQHPTNNHYAICGGTSMAAPIVTGCAALIREYYIKQKKHFPSAALLKASIINSCKKLHGADAVLKFPDIPNFNQGFGLVDMALAIPDVANPFFHWFYDNYKIPAEHFQSTGRKFKVALTTTKKGWIRVCLAYTDFPARALQNNLSLMMDAKSDTKIKWQGNQHAPALLRREDTKNNVKVIHIDCAKADRYTIVVAGSNVPKGPQDFALVITTEDMNASVEIL